MSNNNKKLMKRYFWLEFFWIGYGEVVLLIVKVTMETLKAYKLLLYTVL